MQRYLNINKSQYQDIINDFNLIDDELYRACRRALKKTANSMKRKLIKKASQALATNQKVLRSRIKSFAGKENYLYTKIFNGLYNISLKRLNPRQLKKGVKAGKGGKIFRQSAFITKLRDDWQPNVYKRKGKKRFPVKVQKLSIEEEITEIINNIEGYDFEETFFKKLKEEARWEIMKR